MAWRKNKLGYGRLHYGGGMQYRSAARISWELHFGPIPEGLWVLHKCDNPRCVRPDHLFLGTSLDNVRDMIAKGRRRPASLAARGDGHPQAKLTEEQVNRLRNIWPTLPRSSGGLKIKRGSISAIESEFNIQRSAIYCAVRGKTWGHLLGVRHRPRNYLREFPSQSFDLNAAILASFGLSSSFRDQSAGRNALRRLASNYDREVSSK
jgi:hypothetical protein